MMKSSLSSPGTKVGVATLIQIFGLAKTRLTGLLAMVMYRYRNRDRETF